MLVHGTVTAQLEQVVFSILDVDSPVLSDSVKFVSGLYRSQR